MTHTNMASADSERKRRKLEEAAAGAVAGDGDEEPEEEERWVGPLPGEAAQAKKRRGNAGSRALVRARSLGGR